MSTAAANEVKPAPPAIEKIKVKVDGREIEVPKLSPVDAAARYLQHLRAAWNAHFAGAGKKRDDDAALEKQESELTGLMRDAGDGAGHDQADMGATSFERDQEIIVVQNEREKLAQIDRALSRIADGTYGICESCGNPIGKMRAMAFPRATLCMTCKQREERR